jgi:hypothetical protein
MVPLPNMKTLQIKNIPRYFEVIVGEMTIFRRSTKLGYKYASL